MAGHGHKPLRGLENTAKSSISSGQFGRMFRWLPPAFKTESARDDAALETLFEAIAGIMVTKEFDENIAGRKFKGKGARAEITPDAPIDVDEPDDENPKIPAGYTYLGQFIDHDITFDPASSLQRLNDPDALEDFRTPRLDLDSLYGRGPADQPYLYEKANRAKFVLGPNKGVEGMRRFDLLRLVGDNNTAILGDKRNDENKIVSQIHALFLSFHNKVYDKLAAHYGAGDTDARFLDTQRIVRWCYQWIVLHEYLPKICDKKIVNKLMPNSTRRSPALQFYVPHHGQAYMPVEFSAAAFRFGHSMVRPSYALNDKARSSAKFVFKDKGEAFEFGRIPIFVFQSKNPNDALNGFGEALPDSWGIDWSFFFDGLIEDKDKKGRKIPQPSYRIDTSLVDPLGQLPEFFKIPGLASLAYRNLLRGHSMSLPSGQSIARAIGAEVLSDKQLWPKAENGDKGLADLYKANEKWLKDCAPLWYYILREAEVNHKGEHLGELGSTIVAETIIGLAWHDHYSYLYQWPHWTPAEEEIGLRKDFDMAALIRFVDGG
jgi:hypothetical protein